MSLLEIFKCFKLVLLHLGKLTKSTTTLPQKVHKLFILKIIIYDKTKTYNLNYKFLKFLYFFILTLSIVKIKSFFFLNFGRVGKLIHNAPYNSFRRSCGKKSMQEIRNFSKHLMKLCEKQARIKGEAPVTCPPPQSSEGGGGHFSAK